MGHESLAVRLCFNAYTFRMTAWTAFYERIVDYVQQQDTHTLYYRGHAAGTWELLPGIGRVNPSALLKFKNPHTASLELALYYDFIAHAGDLLPRSNTSWDHLFLMQHHGVPTRLLDWSESFAVALFFALAHEPDKPEIWVLNPYALNRITLGRDEVLDAADFDAGYDEYFITRTEQFPGNVVACRPIRDVRRVAQQFSAFTLHREITSPLDKLHPKVVRRFRIPAKAIDGALQFLDLAGVSDFALFPDLDGLARDLKRRYLWVD